MKIFFALILFFVSFQSMALETPSENRAIRVNFFGGITGFDQGAYKALRATVGSLIADGTVDHFITTSVGLEGGSSFCIELSKNPALSIDPILGALRSIRPSDQSIYNFEAFGNCSIEAQAR